MNDRSANRIEWWPAPRDGELVPDHGPVDLTPYVVGGDLTTGAMEDTSQAMERHARRLAAAEAAMVEKAAEVAAQTGTSGVRVWRYDEGVTVEVDSTVPYGHIYEMPHGQRPPDLCADP